MKMKYTAASALLVWLLVVGWLASMVIAKPAVLRMGNQAEETAEMAELRTGIERNRQTAAAIATLRDAPFPVADGNGVIALPVAAPAPVASAAGGYGATAGGGDPGAGAATRALSLVLVANGRRVAVVDGQYVQVGSRLPDGTRIRAIGQDWVRLDDAAGNRQTLRVLNPLQPVQAGGRP